MPTEIPDLNLFMMCEKLNRDALRPLPEGYHMRYGREDELDIWKAMHFDDPAVAREYHGYMGKYFDAVYAPKGDLFFRRCLYVCDKNDVPVGTCFVWKAYDRVNTIHWYKVLLPYENRGIGRALLSETMKDLDDSDYPVYLHTQPSSYRAIKLYSDFGFAFVTDPVVGHRENHLQQCLPILKEYMPEKDFENLRFAPAGKDFLDAAASSDVEQF